MFSGAFSDYSEVKGGDILGEVPRSRLRPNAKPEMSEIPNKTAESVNKSEEPIV
jgi:hypothetical protein